MLPFVHVADVIVKASRGQPIQTIGAMAVPLSFGRISAPCVTFVIRLIQRTEPAAKSAAKKPVAKIASKIDDKKDEVVRGAAHKLEVIKEEVKTKAEETKAKVDVIIDKVEDKVEENLNFLQKILNWFKSL